MEQQWKVCDLLSQAQFQLYSQAGIDPLQAQLLYNRGVQTPEAMRQSLDARYDQTLDPLTLIDMPRALERVRRALDSGEHITVYGDYDADGVTSSALLTRALRALKQPGAPLDYYIPSRLTEGCGLNIPALDQLKARGTSLIITTDCASSDVEQVEYARSLDIDVIITDHHHPPEHRPDAYAMVNPWRVDSTYGERYLCGAGVAFKLAQALFSAYGRLSEDAYALLDLMALGTIADIAPLLGENHTLVRLGMQQLNQTRKPGLLALIDKANLQLGRIWERDIAYAIAPRINAAGRMLHARIAFDLLTTDDATEAHRYAEELERLNLSRQQQTEELMRSVREQAGPQLQNQVVLVRGENWHEGIIGLVAGKLAEEIQRPVLVLSEDSEKKQSRGSARSQPGFNVILALRGCAPILVRYGGHAQAAGFTIENDHIEELHRHLLEWKDPVEPLIETKVLEAGPSDLEAIAPEPETASPGSTQMVDLIFTRLDRLTYQTYSKIRELGPFGASNPEPTFKMEGLRLLDRWVSGQDGRNLRLRLASGASQRIGTMLRGATQLRSLNGVTHVNIIFRINPSWTPLDDAGKQDIWLKILHVEPAHH